MLSLNIHSLITCYGLSTVILIITLLPVFRYVTEKMYKAAENQKKSFIENEKEVASFLPVAINSFVVAIMVNFIYNLLAIICIFIHVSISFFIILTLFFIFVAFYIFYNSTYVFILTNKNIYLINPFFSIRDSISYDKIKQVKYIDFLKLINIEAGNKKHDLLFFVNNYKKAKEIFKKIVRRLNKLAQQL